MNDFKKYIIPVVLLFVITLLIGAIITKDTSNHTLKNAPTDKEYQVELTSDVKNIKPGELTRMTFKITEDNATLKNFQVVHEKILHLIIIRKDLQEFQHIHPIFDNATGEFSVDISFKTAGPYVLYADFTPATFEDNDKNIAQVAQTTILVGSEKGYKKQQVQTTPSNSVKKDDYEVLYTVDPPRSDRQTYILSITKNNKPVKDLQPYLGAMGHSVLVNTKTLEYVHTHAGDMHMKNGGMDITKMSKGPNLMFNTTPLEAGQYKIFTQFQHQDTVQTSEFVFEVK